MHQLHQKIKAQATQAAVLMTPKRSGEMILKHALAQEITGLVDKMQTITSRWMYANVTHDGELYGIPPTQATVWTGRVQMNASVKALLQILDLVDHLLQADHLLRADQRFQVGQLLQTMTQTLTLTTQDHKILDQ